MAFFVQGHDESNDDLTAPAPSGPGGSNMQNAGWSGSIPPPVDQATFTPWGTQGYTYERDPQTGGVYAVPGTSGADQDVARYRQLGAQQQPAVQLNQGRAAFGRALEYSSLAGLANAARGNAPSRAAELGHLANENAVRGATAAAGAGRGPAGSIAATRLAGGSLMSLGAQTAQGIGDMRAAEMAQARGAYYGAASGIRGQDIGAATTNAQLEAANRALQEQRQEQYEQLGFGRRNEELFAATEQQRQADQNALAQRQLRAAQAQQDFDKARDLASIGVGGAVGLAGAAATANSGPTPQPAAKPDPSLPVRNDPYSDERTKYLVPHGSLASFMR